MRDLGREVVVRLSQRTFGDSLGVLMIRTCSARVLVVQDRRDGVGEVTTTDGSEIWWLIGNASEEVALEV